ncbi:MAG: carbohydrate-binding domain-containing protein [Bacillota bacterium]
MNKKNKYIKLLAVLLCITFLVSCSSNNDESQTKIDSQIEVAEQSNLNTIGDKDISTVISELVTYDKDDYYSDWKNENANYIELKETNANVKGSGAAAKAGKITITEAGVYVISGKLDNGQIVVDVQNKGNVRLVLNGVEINCTDNAPIYVENAGKTIITLQDGTENLISDGEKYVFSDSSTDEPNAAIFSKDSLTINGTGKLTVRGNYNNGVTSKDDLKITGGNIQIYSVDDGLLGRDLVAVKEGNIIIEAGGDGIKSTNDTDTSKGFIVLEGGTFDIKSGTDGIQAATSVLTTGGEFTISSGGGSVNGSNKIRDDRQGPWGNKGSSTVTNTVEEESESAKGIKASVDITISGGTFNIDSADDAIHSNNSITIAGGDISITSGDDGVHADSSILVKGGKMNIVKSYEGIESAVVTVSDGDIHVTSSDDGINIAGGNDGSSVDGRPGENHFSSSENNKLMINGGYIAVDSTGDALDANGSIYMAGGTVIVSGPTTNGNGALDYDGTFELSGGFLVAAGSAGMAQAPSEQSAQYSIIMNYSQTQQAGTVVHLKDNEGNTVVTFAPKKNYQSVVISSSELKKDTTYTLYAGGTSTGSGTDGLYTDGEYKGGTKIVEFTISNSVTWLSETGVTTSRSSNPGGANNPGFGGNENRPEKRKP